MRVLMFGWEFPPHISGGLGTACLGLTSAMIKEGTDILFVVPKTHGDEKSPHLIDASQVIMKTSDHFRLPLGIAKEKLDVISVPAALTPYTSSSYSDPVMQWNYEFTFPNEVKAPGGKRYNFTGGYGPFLLHEVERYAQVALTIARENSFDVIHAHDWHTFPAGIEAKRLTGKPLIVHIHSTEYDRAGDNGDPGIHQLEHLGMLEADGVIAVSQWTKNIITSRYNIPDEKISVVYNGIDEKLKTKAKPLPFPQLGSHMITYLGRVTYQKGPLYFVEAAKKVSHQLPDAHFIVAGAGDLLPAVIEKVAQYRLSSRFHFTGFLQHDQVDRVWAISDLYVMPSVSEPFGLVPLEAIQSGVPVILSNQSGVAEIIPHTIKVDFWDTDAMADAICGALKHKSLFNTVKNESRNDIRRITWEQAAKKLNHIYHELLQA